MHGALVVLADMTGKKAKGKGAAEAAPQSLLRMLDASLRGDQRRLVLRLAAERIRTGILYPDEAELIAGWLTAIGEGSDAKKTLFGETRGRKPGGTGSKVVRGEEVRLPDHPDLVLAMHQAVLEGRELEAVIAQAAKRFGVSSEYLHGLYQLLLPEIIDKPNPK